jgi:hypothetical protein
VVQETIHEKTIEVDEVSIRLAAEGNPLAAFRKPSGRIWRRPGRARGRTW